MGTQKQVQQRPGDEEQYPADGEGHGRHEQQAFFGAGPDPVQLARPVVLAHEGGEGGAEGAGDGPEGPVHLAAHGPGGHHHRAQGVDAHLQQQVREPVHGALDPGGDADPQHPHEEPPVPLAPEPQPEGPLQGQELAGDQQGRHRLAQHRSHGHAHDAPGKDDNEDHVQNDVEAAAHEQAQEGKAGVADGAQDPGAHVEEEQEHRAHKVDTLIEQGLVEGVRRGLEQGEELGGEQAHQGPHDQAQHHAQPVADPHGCGHPLVLLGPVELGDDHRGAAGQGHEEPDDQIAQYGGAATHGGQGLRAHELAHHEGVHCVIELLEQSACRDGQEEQHQLFDDRSFDEVVSRFHSRFLHPSYSGPTLCPKDPDVKIKKKKPPLGVRPSGRMAEAVFSVPEL